MVSFPQCDIYYFVKYFPLLSLDNFKPSLVYLDNSIKTPSPNYVLINAKLTEKKERVGMWWKCFPLHW